MLISERMEVVRQLTELGRRVSEVEAANSRIMEGVVDVKDAVPLAAARHDPPPPDETSPSLEEQRTALEWAHKSLQLMPAVGSREISAKHEAIFEVETKLRALEKGND